MGWGFRHTHQPLQNKTTSLLRGLVRYPGGLGWVGLDLGKPGVLGPERANGFLQSLCFSAPAFAPPPRWTSPSSVVKTPQLFFTHKDVQTKDAARTTE